MSISKRGYFWNLTINSQYDTINRGENMLNVLTLTLPPFGTNTYIVFEKTKGKCIIIDPASSFELIKNKIDEFELKPILVFLTHGHFDHIGACDKLREEYNIPLAIHECDAPLLIAPQLNASKLLLGKEIKLKPAEKIISKPTSFKLENKYLRVVHTPGHTKGSCVLVCDDEVFSGDTLFKGGYGRYDLPGGSADELIKSLEKILNLDERLKVYPGHGETTSIFQEKDILQTPVF